MKRWYDFTFKINSPNSKNPKVWVDIFIIDKIVRDMIVAGRSEIVLWRIHRRWSDDESGHELTFDSFTGEETASQIEKLTNGNKFYKILQENKLIVEDLRMCAKGENIRDIADDESTRDWPEGLKEAWPYYIHGCSEMFLCLIDVLKKDIKPSVDKTNQISEIENFYTKLEKRLSEIWQYHGSHAFFHHINAIFGYAPLLVKPTGLDGILDSF